MTDKETIAKMTALLTQSAFTCQVDFMNHINDGSYISGILAHFMYDDNTQSESNNPNVNIPYGGAQSLYSTDKCVKHISIAMALRRPDGSVNVLTGDSGDSPAGKCWVHEGWSAVPATQIAKADSQSTKFRPATVARESA